MVDIAFDELWVPRYIAPPFPPITFCNGVIARFPLKLDDDIFKLQLKRLVVIAPPPPPTQTLELKFEFEIDISVLTVNVTKLIYRAPIFVYAPIISSPLMTAALFKSSIFMI